MPRRPEELTQTAPITVEGYIRLFDQALDQLGSDGTTVDPVTAVINFSREPKWPHASNNSRPDTSSISGCRMARSAYLWRTPAVETPIRSGASIGYSLQLFKNKPPRDDFRQDRNPYQTRIV